MVSYSRIWKMDSDKISAKDVHDYIVRTKGKFETPLVITGTILSRHETIELSDIADDEVLMYEIAWETQSNNKLGFGFAPEQT
jgi:hypothetical protein